MNTLSNQQQHTHLLHIKQAGLLCSGTHVPTVAEERKPSACLSCSGVVFMLSESELSDSGLCWWQQKFIYLQKFNVKFHKIRITGNTGENTKKEKTVVWPLWSFYVRYGKLGTEANLFSLWSFAEGSCFDIIFRLYSRHYNSTFFLGIVFWLFSRHFDFCIQISVIVLTVF